VKWFIYIYPAILVMIHNKAWKESKVIKLHSKGYALVGDYLLLLRDFELYATISNSVCVVTTIAMAWFNLLGILKFLACCYYC
jgi:protein associated with RNAse G/E